MLKRWAWTLGTVAYAVGIFALVVQQLVAFNAIQIVAIFIYAGILWYMFQPGVRAAFGKEPSSLFPGPADASRTADPSTAEKRRRAVMIAAVSGALVAGALIAVIATRLLDRDSSPATESAGGNDASPAPLKAEPPGGKVVYGSGMQGSDADRI